MDGRAPTVTSVRSTQAVSTAPARSLGSAHVTRAGAASSVTKTSTFAPTIDPARTEPRVLTLLPVLTRASVHRASLAPTARSSTTLAPPRRVVTVALASIPGMTTSCASVPLATPANIARYQVSHAPTDLVCMVPPVLTLPRATSAFATRATRVPTVNGL